MSRVAQPGSAQVSGPRKGRGTDAFVEPIGPAGDALEREADRVADAVVRGTLLHGGGGWAAAGADDTIRRKCAECEEEEEEQIRRSPVSPGAPEPGGREGVTPAAPSPVPAEDGEGLGHEATPPLALIVDDEGDAAAGQMRKTEFLAALRREVCASVDEGLSGTGRDSQGCPWIDHWFGYYEGRTASQIERALRRYAPESAGAAGVHDYLPVVAERVRAAARQYARTGAVTGVPDDTAAGTSVGGDVVDGFGGMFFKSRSGGHRSADPVSVRDRLGRGEPLPGAVRARMELAFGTGFGEVRMHADATGAALARHLNAHAFAVGEHVAFGAGEFQPGTLPGDTLIAHELAHVVQQRGAQPLHASAGRGRQTALEDDADRSAASFVHQQFAKGREVAQQAAPRLRSGLTLSRCSSKSQPKDFRAGASLPDATQQAKIQSELHPTSAAPGAPLPMWDAHSTSAGTAAQKAARKTDLKDKVTKAMKDELDAMLPTLNALKSSGRVAITALEGPGRAAKKVVDQTYAEWISVAALTPSQASLRHGFAFRASGAGQNLFDANDTAQRAAAGLPIDPQDLASWMAETHGSAAMRAHDFSPNRDPEEVDFFTNQIVIPFAAARDADLKLFDLFGFAVTDPSTGKIVTPTVMDPGVSTTPGPGGRPSPAERAVRWSTWETLVHEYIHTLEHPVFSTAGGAANRIMSEGFCTLFSEEVLTAQIPKAPKDATIRAEVEGGSFPEPPAGTVPPFDAGSYAEYLTHAKEIRNVVGNNAMKAAFFQGHVEFLGLNPAGGTTTPVVPAERDVVGVPAGVTTVAALAHAANVSAADIVAANSGLTATSAVSGRVHVPGAREHVVVSAGTHGVETKQQIAKQNGVSEDALARANPGLAWASLSAGDRVLIPKH